MKLVKKKIYSIHIFQIKIVEKYLRMFLSFNFWNGFGIDEICILFHSRQMMKKKYEINKVNHSTSFHSQI